MKRKGFILLITIILLSAIMFGAVLNESGRLAGFRTMNDEMEFKMLSLELAKSCRNEALLSLALDPTFRASQQSMSVGSSTCSIDSVEHISESASGTALEIFSSGSMSTLHTHLRTNILLNDSGLTLQSSYEIPNFN